MDISTLSGVSPAYLNTYTQKTSFDDDNNKTNSFDSILSAMMSVRKRSAVIADALILND